MNEIIFIEKLHKVLKNGTINDIEDTIRNPPGRQPDKSLLALSKWYNSLQSEDKANLRRIINLSVDSAIFGFLCILDGVRTIEDNFEKGTFELYYKKGEKKILLYNENKEFLHDIYKSI